MFRPQRENQDQNPPISNALLGMVFLLFTEVMFFSGLICAYLVNRVDSTIQWPPPGQWRLRLPVEETAINTLILLMSGFTAYLAVRAFKERKSAGMKRVNRWLLITILLGSLFILFQGYEWINLLKYGLNTTSTLFGAFFYAIIGAHALHVAAGLLTLLIITLQYSGPEKKALKISGERLFAGSLYWYFVVGVWPIIYLFVYLL